MPVDFEGPVTFRSTLPAALTVDSSGLVTVADSGHAYIVATTEFGGRVLRDSVAVVGIDPGFTVRLSLRGFPNSHTFAVPQSGSLAVTALNRQGDTTAVPGPVQFRSTDTKSFIVDTAGQVSAIAPGAAYIVGQVPTEHGFVADSIRFVAVCKSILEHKVLSPPPKPFRVGMSFPMDMTFTICDGYIALTPKVHWHSPDTTVVSIDTAAFRVIARGPGATTLVVTLTEWSPGSTSSMELWFPIVVEP